MRAGAEWSRGGGSGSAPGEWAHVAANLGRVHAAIVEAAERAGRDAAAVTLVAVSKGCPPAAVEAALAAGQTVFGENRVQEALSKQAALEGRGARFHLIGHLQTNKARHAGAFDMIESVDSLRVARAIDQHLQRRLPILLEVNVAGEASKGGFAPEETGAALAAMRDLAHLDVRGLMTVAPLVAEAEATRAVFRRLRELAAELGLETLSMGMTNDFPVAVAEGATIVRVGRAIFGERAAAGGASRAGRQA